jgi:hypothetical protein
MSEAAVSSDTKPQVLACIQAVMADMAKIGVGKTKTNTQQNFQYRGIDDIMDALSGSLARHGLIITPRVLERDAVLRETRNGGTVKDVTLKIEYDFEAVADSSKKIVGPVFAEAMDSGDKATSKAMSMAYKDTTTKEFCIAFTAQPDPDAESHEIVGGAQAPREQPPIPHREVRSPSPSATREPAPQRETIKGAEHLPIRPSGIFGYGKKNYETPWDVMSTRDLEWFLNAERTPQHVREKIMAELEWREHEAAQFAASEAAVRLKRETEVFDEHIP